MRILLLSHVFSPSIGGIESVSRLLAEEFSRQAHTVIVLTQTAAPIGEAATAYRVVRRPNRRELWQWYRWSDVVIQNNISLRTLWPALGLRRRVLVLHQTWFHIGDQGTALTSFAKHCAMIAVKNAFISRALAEGVRRQGPVLGNPYDARVFHEDGRSGAPRGDLVFVGRLVEGKGVQDLFRALTVLAQRGLRPRLTVVGDGPERAGLEAAARDSGLAAQVSWTGSQSGETLAATLRDHRILVVPSRWPEPFGIVALEGIACGCVVVASRGGGLPEAVGPCGRMYANGNAGELAQVLADLLMQPEAVAELRRGAAAHLRPYQPGIYATRLLALATNVQTNDNESEY